MLEARLADIVWSMGSLLRFASMLACAFVLVSFGLFAIAQTSHASHGQVSALNAGSAGASTGAPTPIAREHQPRRFIDSVARDLNSPWADVVSSRDRWVTHIVPTLISLLLYGFVLSYLARWAAGRPA